MTILELREKRAKAWEAAKAFLDSHRTDKGTLFERLAKERNITVEEMRAIISARIEAGMNDPDPEKRASWERIPRTGEIPTPEEWLRYAVERLEEEGRDDLLRRYLMF